MSKLKVVFFCQHDWAGAAYQTVNAINSIGRIEARQVLCNKHPYGYDADIVLRSSSTSKTNVNDCDRYEEACQVLLDADYIHTWNNELIDFYGSKREFRGTFPPLKNENYKSCTFTGTWYRLYHKQINKRLQAANIKLVVQTPGFIMPSMESTFIQHTLDMDEFVPLPIDQRDANTIGCYHHAGTTADKDIVQLKNILKKSYPDWRVVMEQNGISHQDRLKQLSKCMFFMQDLDDRMISYGVSTLEALALGVPVINSVHSGLHKYMKDIPIISATPETLTQAIDTAFTSDYAELSKRSRDWVIKYHGYNTIGEEYTKFFEELS